MQIIRSRNIRIISMALNLFILTALPRLLPAQVPTYLTKWGSSGSGNGTFGGCVGVAASGLGYVYSADFANNLIQRFDSSGNFLNQWGGPGTANGQFSAPNEVAVDLSGNVYVIERSGDRVQVFDPSGVFLFKFGTTGSGNGQFIGAVG